MGSPYTVSRGTADAYKREPPFARRDHSRFEDGITVREGAEEGTSDGILSRLVVILQ